MKDFHIPAGELRTREDDEAARRRRQIREQLLRGSSITVTPSGTLQESDKSGQNQEGIKIPPGKLANFHWYERDRELLEAEVAAMSKYFPQFSCVKLDDGRLAWHGNLMTDLRPGGAWHLAAIYDHNHPHSNTYGGSIKVYSLDPDLEELQQRLQQTIPHLLRDSSGGIYLCTSGFDDFKSNRVVTTAASALAWGAKWIAAFELWLAGDLSTQDFAGHRI